MVAKISSPGTSIYGVLKYNVDKVMNEKAKILYSQKIAATDQEGQPDINRMQYSFETYLKNNRRTEKPVFHVSLNPAPGDNLTDEQLKEIAQKYMTRLGYGKQPFIVFKHSDIGREHIHIASIRTDEDGKKIKDSYEHEHSKQITNSIEQEYNLIPSTKKEQGNSISELKKVNYQQGNVKNQVGNTVRALLENYRFTSFNEFRALLSLYNVTADEVKGIANGKMYTGVVYSALDENGDKAGKPLKSSLWGKDTGNNALQKIMQETREAMKEQPEVKNRMKRIISGCLKGTNDRVLFEKELKAKGIEVIFRENEDKRIYGVTFVNHRDKIVLNGSKLGKEFSANYLNDWFNNTTRPQQSHQAETITHKPEHHKPEQSIIQTSGGNVVSDLFNAFSFDNAPAEEKPMQRKRKPKRKKGRQI